MNNEPINKKCRAKLRGSLRTCNNEPMGNGRCWLHGGKSTGPRSRPGLERSRKANFKHGFYSKAVKEERKAINWFFREMKKLILNQEMESAYVLMGIYEKEPQLLKQCVKDESIYKLGGSDG